MKKSLSDALAPFSSLPDEAAIQFAHNLLDEEQKMEITNVGSLWMLCQSEMNRLPRNSPGWTRAAALSDACEQRGVVLIIKAACAQAN